MLAWGLFWGKELCRLKEFFLLRKLGRLEEEANFERRDCISQRAQACIIDLESSSGWGSGDHQKIKNRTWSTSITTEKSWGAGGGGVEEFTKLTNMCSKSLVSTRQGLVSPLSLTLGQTWQMDMQRTIKQPCFQLLSNWRRKGRY